MLIPENVKELRTYLETFDGSLSILIETKEFDPPKQFAVLEEREANTLILVPIEFGPDGLPVKA